MLYAGFPRKFHLVEIAKKTISFKISLCSKIFCSFNLDFECTHYVYITFNENME